MATLSKLFLSGSTHGRPIKVTGTATGSSVTIHQAVTGTSNIDEIYLYANSTSTAPIKLTIELGGTTDPDDLLEVTILGENGLILLLPGLIMNNALYIKAWAGTANVINIVGFVNRITA
jgi:hypothetical protein